jgi:UPF0716 protein FxsA
VLLAVPGFVSGLLGALLLAPPLRAAARRGLEGWAVRRVPAGVAGDLFGPRRVRVRQGRADPAPPPPADGRPQPAIEGEIVGPDGAGPHSEEPPR